MKRLIICPVYNEEKYIRTVINEIRSACNYPLLIVDDGSIDNTSKIIESGSPDFLIGHNKNLGYGRSLIHGFNFAIKKGYSYIITIDGDLQHDPTLIPIFFEKVMQYDIISGNRYSFLFSSKINPPKSHYIYHRVIANILNDTFESSIRDVFCGYNAYNVKKLKLLELDIDGYGISIQIITQMLYKKIKYIELPVPMIYHNSFRDKMPPKEKLEYFLEVLKSELQRIGRYDEDIFIKHIPKGGIKWANL